MHARALSLSPRGYKLALVLRFVFATKTLLPINKWCCKGGLFLCFVPSSFTLLWFVFAYTAVKQTHTRTNNNESHPIHSNPIHTDNPITLLHRHTLTITHTHTPDPNKSQTINHFVMMKTDFDDENYFWKVHVIWSGASLNRQPSIQLFIYLFKSNSFTFSLHR